MKWLLVFLVFALNASQVPLTFMDCHKVGMVQVENGKIQLTKNRLSILEDEIVFLTNHLEWIPVGNALGEILGVATIEDFRQECKDRKICLKMHAGIYWSPKWELWFCGNQCPYNFYKNFPDGKLE